MGDCLVQLDVMVKKETLVYLAEMETPVTEDLPVLED